MDRLLAEVLCLLTEQRAPEARALALTDPSAAAGALAGFAAFMAGEHAAILTTCRPAGTPVDRMLEAAVRVLAASVGQDDAARFPATLDELGDAATALDAAEAAGAAGGAARVVAFARYLGVEAAMAAARLDLSVAIHAGGPPARTVWAGHPFAGVMLVCDARIAAFTGNIDGARALVETPAPEGMVGNLHRATQVLIVANGGDAEQTCRLVAEVAETGVAPIDHLGRGIHLLLSFGVISLGQVDDAVRHLLAAGGGPELAGLTLIDRVLGYETLVNAAIRAEDLEAARAWEQRAAVWEDNRATAPAVCRIRSRVALMDGDPAAAERWALAAIASAAAEDRGIEKAEGEILLARARIAGARIPEATKGLREAVADADGAGHHAVRLAATRELRPARRRLPPPAGGGWSALSPREADVATALLEGAGNAAIAIRLHLSPATVRAHTTRILAAFGVATRIGLLVATRPEPRCPVALPGLTARQAEVVELLARGQANAEIAERFGLQVKSVERHVSDALVRTGASNRYELAHAWWDLQARQDA